MFDSFKETMIHSVLKSKTFGFCLNGFQLMSLEFISLKINFWMLIVNGEINGGQGTFCLNLCFLGGFKIKNNSLGDACHLSLNRNVYRLES